MKVFIWRMRHVYLPKWHMQFRTWWMLNPSLTRFLPKWVNKRLQRWGEERRSAIASQEPETNMPFPYNNELYLDAYCTNRKFAEPDFEAYWNEQQRILDLKYLYRKLPGPHFELSTLEP